VLKSAFSLPLRVLAALLTTGTLASACAQSAPAAPAPPADPRAASPVPAKPDPNADFLAKASQLYYSSAKAGLRGFDCRIHPDWRTTILSEQTNPTATATSPEVQLLKSVTITLHGRLTGGSTIDWNPPPSAAPLNPQSQDLLDHMHQGVERSLTGFMQFWAPFVDGSVIPATSQGIEITHAETVHTIHADQEGVSLTEILGKDLVIQQFNVVTGDAKINFSPRYKSTAQGLLASGFNANMQGPSEAADQAQHMQVEVEYQTVSGFPIPARIVMEVAGGEKFDFALDECVANPPAS
jgi:hypothetical protein